MHQEPVCVKLWGKCCVDAVFEGSCPIPIPPGDFLRISTCMLESTGAVCVLVDLQLIQVCPAYLMHSGCTATLVIPRAFLQWL